MNSFRASLLGATALWVARLCAQSTPVFSDTPGEGTWSMTNSVTSQYMFRGARLAGAAYQPSIDYLHGPLSLGVWSSFAFSDHQSGDADPEIDLYGAYSFRSSSGNFDLTPGLFIYTYPDADRSTGQYAASFEPSLAANIVWKSIRFTPKVYYDLTLEGATFELSAAYAFPLTSLGTELDFNASVGSFKWNSVTARAEPSVKNWGDYWLVGVALPYQISARGKLALSVTYSEGRNNFFKQAGVPQERNTDAVGRAAVAISYTVEL